LLARVETHSLSAPGEPLAFQCRLASDNGWTLGHAVRVVREYRRFLVLTQVAAATVCPSDDVDRAWHLHITRTADYERFCSDVFGRFLHHQPAGSGPHEHERHHAMYDRTLSLYRRAFGVEAPATAWPAPAQRFAPAERYRKDAIVLRGPFAFGVFLTVALLAAVFVLAMSLNLLGVLDATHEMSGPAFLRIATPATIALVVLGWLATAPYTRVTPRDTLDAYEAAWLAGGDARMAATAIGLLVERGHLLLSTSEVSMGRLRKSTTRLTAVPPSCVDALHPVELACLAATRDGTLSFEQAQAAVLPWAQWIRGRLREAGLAVDERRIAPARAAMAIVASAGLVVAVERILHAVQTPRPMGFLVALTLIDTVLVAALTLQPGRASWRGHRALRELGHAVRTQRTNADRRARRANAPPAIDARLLPMTLALVGPSAVLAQPLFAGLGEAIGSRGMQLANANANSVGACSGGSGGCGGGGCGGGGCGG
jgi:uncharacterized protein (TIGR04222 family)